MLPSALVAAFVLVPLDVPPKAAVRPRESVRPMQGWAEQLRKCGMERRHAGRLYEALAAFNAALLLDPNSDSAYAGRGKTLTLLGRHDKAADDYARMIALAPNDWESWQCVAEGWMLRGRYDEAQRCFDHTAGLRPPGKWRCDARLAEMALWAGTETTAVQLTLSPETVANTPAERQCRAETAVVQALLLETDGTREPRAKLYACRGYIRHGMGRHFEAVADYDRALEVVTTDASLHYYRAQLAHLQRDEEKALHHLDLAEQAGLERRYLVDLRGEMHCDTHEWEQAAACAAEWCRLEPENPYPFRTNSVLLCILGQDEAAVEAAERAAKLAKTSTVVELCSFALRTLDGLGRKSEVDRLLTRTLDLPGVSAADRGMLYFMRGMCRDFESRTAEGFEDVTRSVRICPDVPGSRVVRAELAMHQKRTAAAMEDVEAACRLQPYDSRNWELLRAVRGQEEVAAAIAGRKPDYRPAGPVVRVPITVAPGAQYVRLTAAARPLFALAAPPR